jgi:predicted PurR-regulated permease PerM
MNKKNRTKLYENDFNEKLINYTLTIGFIFLIVFFISSIILISRFVFVGTSIGEHVQITKELIGNINKIEKETNNSENLLQELNNNNFFNLNPSNSNIISYSYLNTNNNQSFITIKFNSSIKKIDKYLYIPIINISYLEKNTIIIYFNSIDEKHEIGKFISYENNEIYIFDIENNDFLKIDPESIKGEIIFIEKNEKN